MTYISKYIEAWKEDDWFFPLRIQRWINYVAVVFLCSLLALILAVSFIKPLDRYVLGLAAEIVIILLIIVAFHVNARRSCRQPECPLISKELAARPSTVLALLEQSLTRMGYDLAAIRMEQRPSFPYLDLMVYDLDGEGTILRVKKVFGTDGLELGRMKHRLMTRIEIGPVRERTESLVDELRVAVDDLELPDHEEDVKAIEGLTREADLWYNTCIVWLFVGITIIIILFPTSIVVELFNPRVDFIPVMLTATFMIFLIAGVFFTRAYREYLRPDLM